MDYGFEKRESYRAAFHQFDPKNRKMTALDIDACMQNSGLIRHRAKLEAIVKMRKLIWQWKSAVKISVILFGHL